MNYEAVIGLEIHVQLNSPTKLFCDCPNDPAGPPNAHICPACLGLPGALKRLGRLPLEKGVLSCLALNCEVQPLSAFDQKVYYYPDLPRGFQLSQFHKPLGKNGRLEVPAAAGGRERIRIREAHLEEDVARLVHVTEGRKSFSLIDFNRAGAPLLEIVTDPDIRSPREAMEFVRLLRASLRYAGTAECSMEEGTLRVDANISIRPEGSEKFFPKVEVKNLNSIRHLGEAVAFEIVRQSELAGEGKPVTVHTRLWDPERNVTVPMRGKFAGPCVPDPSIPPVSVSPGWIAELASRLPKMPAARREEYERLSGLTPEDAGRISSERDLAEYFEAAVAAGAPPKPAVDWIEGRLRPLLRERNESLAGAGVTPARLAELILLVERKEISSAAGKEVLAQLFESGLTPAELAERAGLTRISDTAALEGIVESVLAANPAAVEDYRAGKKPALGFLVGQAMQASSGQADPRAIRGILEGKLSSGA